MSSTNRNEVISNEKQDVNLEVITNTKSKAFDFEGLKAFLDANQTRGVTRSEIADFCGLARYSSVKTKIEKLADSQKYFDIIIDLRKNHPPEGKLIIPGEVKTEESESNKEILECNSESNSEFNKDISENNGEIVEELTLDKVENLIPNNSTVFPNEQTQITKISELFGIKNKIKNILFDDSIFHLDHKKDFYTILNEIISYNEKIVIWLFEEQILHLDCIKKEHKIAQEILKLFALDEEKMHTKIIKGSMPKNEKLGEYCRSNKLVFVSGDANNIAWCKVWSANVYIPNYFRELYPSPFTGKQIVGVDSNVLCYNFVKDIFSSIKKIVISDIQLRERGGFGCTEFHKFLAYYGEFGKAQYVNNSPDQSIVYFFKQRQVEKAYTADYGFKVFARIANLPTEVVSTNSNTTNNDSEILNLIENKENTENFMSLNEDSIVKIDNYVDNSNGKLRVIKDSEEMRINVYNNQNKKKETPLRFIDVFKHDTISVIKDKIILIVEVVSTSSATGKILYFGEISNLPKKCVKYLS